ncbi:MAG: FAD-dependent oxidoreductase [Rhizobiaceae bacterium]|nr:FAD-dependent oxidoreductase [Rhizobiaceae bacterium]
MTKRIVLVGGGHTHLQLVEAFGKRPLAGWTIVLVSPERIVAYSGMAPGVVAGHYRPDDLEIDLERLCAAHDTEFRRARVVGIDRNARRAGLEDGSSIRYDLLSLDVGSVPATAGVAGAAENALPLKPIGHFLGGLDAILGTPKPRIVVVGGGPAGVEVALALRHRLRHAGHGAALSLVAAGPILEDLPAGVRRYFRSLLAQRHVQLIENAPVSAIAADAVHLEDGREIASDLTLLATGAAPPAWLARTGLQLSNGFVAVHPTLQTLTDPDIFAAGDCAEIVGIPRPKAGVFAVRAGPPLAANLRARAERRPLQPWSPQKKYLAVLATGPKHAVAVRGRFFVTGRWVWFWKDRIDRNWVRRFRP